MSSSTSSVEEIGRKSDLDREAPRVPTPAFDPAGPGGVVGVVIGLLEAAASVHEESGRKPLAVAHRARAADLRRIGALPDPRPDA